MHHFENVRSYCTTVHLSVHHASLISLFPFKFLFTSSSSYSYCGVTIGQNLLTNCTTPCNTQSFTLRMEATYFTACSPIGNGTSECNSKSSSPFRVVESANNYDTDGCCGASSNCANANQRSDMSFVWARAGGAPAGNQAFVLSPLSSSPSWCMNLVSSW